MDRPAGDGLDWNASTESGRRIGFEPISQQFHPVGSHRGDAQQQCAMKAGATKLLKAIAHSRQDNSELRTAVGMSIASLGGDDRFEMEKIEERDLKKVVSRAVRELRKQENDHLTWSQKMLTRLATEAAHQPSEMEEGGEGEDDEEEAGAEQDY
jgi:hypothetical protein